MPALYLHIPFCRKACHYCNFHFSTSARGHQKMVDTIAREIALRSHEMPAGPWDSVYFGGGTPSLLRGWGSAGARLRHAAGTAHAATPGGARRYA